MGLSYQHYSQNGRAILFSFHDHDPRFGNSNFHIHLYDNPFEEVQERYQRFSLYGNYYLNKRFSVAWEIPYHTSTRFFKEGEPYTLKGIGDVKIGATYHLYDSKLFKPKSTVQQISTLSIFGKFKSGKFNIANELNDIDPYLQAGTGSFDVAASLQHDILFKRLYFNAVLRYLHTGVSYYQLKLGNRYAFQLGGAYRILNRKNLQLNILSDVSYEKKQQDRLENKLIERPNQYQQILYSAGLLLNYSTWAIQIQTAVPVYRIYDDFMMQWKTNTAVKIFYTLN